MNAIKEIAFIYGVGFGNGVAVFFFCEQAVGLVREIIDYFKNKKADKSLPTDK